LLERVVTVSKVIWCDNAWFPYSYGFCPDEAAWKRECKRLGVPEWVYPTADAMCTHLVKTDKTNPCTIVTVNDEKRKSIDTVTFLVHEASHIWRQICETIGERCPSSEFEAYSMQNISKHLIYAYEKTRGKLCRG
jgi:hypothetical protein